MSWKYYYIVMREFEGEKREYPIVRYAENLRDALEYAYPKSTTWEPILAREATEFEIEGKHKGAFLL